METGTRRRSKPYNKEDVRFVYENYASMTASEIAAKRDVSKFQVAKIVSELRQYGVDLPRKTVRRENPIMMFMKEQGMKPKQVRGGKGKKKTPKK